MFAADDSGNKPVSIIITTILLVGTAVFIVVLKRKNKLAEGGV